MQILTIQKIHWNTILHSQLHPLHHFLPYVHGKHLVNQLMVPHHPSPIRTASGFCFSSLRGSLSLLPSNHTTSLSFFPRQLSFPLLLPMLVWFRTPPSSLLCTLLIDLPRKGVGGRENSSYPLYFIIEINDKKINNGLVHSIITLPYTIYIAFILWLLLCCEELVAVRYFQTSS